MKKTLLILLALGLFQFLSGQNIVFSDNFESGTTNWTLTSPWGLSTASSHSTSHSLTESPVGNYSDNLNYVTATLAIGIDLSSALSSDLNFWAKYDIEGGFDYMYLDVSPNGGTTWINLDSFDDTLSIWTQFNYSLGGYVGNPNVKIRFRFFSDGAVNYDGMYIDDVVITSDTIDNAKPLVLHAPPIFYEGVYLDDTIKADIIDISGIQTAELKYRVDGSSFSTISGTNISGDNYEFIIPQQPAGAMVDYFFRAVDSSSSSNTEITDTFSYLAGEYIYYDNGLVDFVDSTGVGESVAMKVTLSGTSSLKSILLRNYTDPNRPNDSMLVHIWTNNAGVPGTDIITPFKVMPSANLQNTSPMTVIDLRSYSTQLSNLTGDIFIGFSVPTGSVWVTITSPGINTRSYLKSSSTSWTPATSGTTGSADFHFRAITAPYCPPYNVGFTFDTLQSPTVLFSDTSSPTPTSWMWDFGDGNSSNIQNPTHTYNTFGNISVTLKVGNPQCGLKDSSVNIINLLQKAPLADFSFDTTFTPSIFFQDSSMFAPTQWLWDFDDNGATSTLQNTAYQFPNSGGTFHVCLTATNTAGSNTACKDIIIIPNGIGIFENPYDDHELNIYPNPMQTKAFIEIGSKYTKHIEFKLFDMQGKEVHINYQQLSLGIEIYRGTLTRGQYIFEIYHEEVKIKTGNLLIQ